MEPDGVCYPPVDESGEYQSGCGEGDEGCEVEGLDESHCLSPFTPRRVSSRRGYSLAPTTVEELKGTSGCVHTGHRRRSRG